ncbi:GNAT family N-acetyltransferase [Kushneria sp. AK178]
MTSDPQDISLRSCEEQDTPALKAFSLPEEQARYTSLPATFLDHTKRYPRDRFMVILEGARPVGFFVLKHDPTGLGPYVENETLVLSALSINAGDQGKGHAKRGMRLLKGYVESAFPGIKSVVLGVNVNNPAAQSLYEKTGFEDTGRTVTGAMGEQKVFKLTCGHSWPGD